MKHSTTTPTLAEARRFRKLKAMGCIACRLNGENIEDTVPPEIHHIKAGNRRIGHEATLPLCYWHHQGTPYDDVPASWFLETLGPSVDKHSRAFHQRYGSDTELLEMVNELLKEVA